jgi:hypothetical protein
VAAAAGTVAVGDGLRERRLIAALAERRARVPMVTLASARGVHERGAVRGQRRGHEDKDHEEEAEELFHISITAKDTISETAGKKQEVGGNANEGTERRYI